MPRAKPLEIKVIAERVAEDPAISEWVTRLEVEAERDFATGTVSLRWGRGQIAVVKHAAAIMGLPYQTYLKPVVYRQALADIEQARAALGAPEKPPRPRTRKAG